ncbi:MAG TPA: glycosyltransferase family 2 protein [Vicinamibacterales bacterium]
MTVAVLIVNWNSGGLLKRCLQCVSAQQVTPDEVMVVDNASTDDSLQQASEFLKDAQLIQLESNTGFAHANNVGAAATRADLLALLNPDAFPDPGWLGRLLAAAGRTGPETASFASQLRFDDDPTFLDGAGDAYHVSGRAWRAGHGTSADGWPARDVEVFAPCAAAALYRREAFEAVGRFDERYFAYFEDVDLGFRLRLHGYRSLYVHDAVVRHVSSALSGYRSNFAVYHGERNMVWTYVKDMPSPLVWLYLPQHLLLNVASLCVYPWRGQGRVAFRAKLDAIRGLARVIRERRQIQRARSVDPWAVRNALVRGLAVPYRRLLERRSRPSRATGRDGIYNNGEPREDTLR